MASHRWIKTDGGIPYLARAAMVYVKGRYGDIYGPAPFGLIDEEAWSGNMFHGAHDLIAYRIAE